MGQTALEVRTNTPIIKPIETSRPPQIAIGSLDSTTDLDLATTYISNGIPIVFQIRRVFGVCLNGSDQKMISAVRKLKGDPDQNRPFSVMLKTERLLNLVDHHLIHPEISALMSDPDLFDSTVALICHLRLPITSQAVKTLPESVVSYQDGIPYIHNLNPAHHPASGLVEKLDQKGFPLVAVTTLNEHQFPEITDLNEALYFCRINRNRTSIPLVLTDPIPIKPDFKGSFPIVDISRRDDNLLRLVRHGHIPSEIVSRVLNVPLDTSQSKNAAYPTIDLSHLLIGNEHLSPREIRDLAIGYIGIKVSSGH